MIRHFIGILMIKLGALMIKCGFKVSNSGGYLDLKVEKRFIAEEVAATGMVLVALSVILLMFYTTS